MRTNSRNMTLIAALCLLDMFYGDCQTAQKSLDKLKRDRVYTFLLNDGSCKFGELAASDQQSVTIRSGGQQDTTASIADITQIAQGSELFYDSRSSWTDVQSVKLYARELMIITLKDGDVIRGKPQNVDNASLTIKLPFSTKILQKSAIQNVVTLKLRPATASFEFVQEEAGFFQIFYPEFYQRALRSEGLVPVKLYDSSQVEDDSDGIVRCNSRNNSGYSPR